MVASNGKFLGADLGDNYPRGIRLLEFDGTAKESKVVYNVKTKHCTVLPCYLPEGDAKVYSEISNDAIT